MYYLDFSDSIDFGQDVAQPRNLLNFNCNYNNAVEDLIRPEENDHVGKVRTVINHCIRLIALLIYRVGLVFLMVKLISYARTFFLSYTFRY